MTYPRAKKVVDCSDNALFKHSGFAIRHFLAGGPLLAAFVARVWIWTFAWQAGSHKKWHRSGALVNVQQPLTEPDSGLGVRVCSGFAQLDVKRLQLEGSFQAAQPCNQLWQRMSRTVRISRSSARNQQNRFQQKRLTRHTNLYR